MKYCKDCQYFKRFYLEPGYSKCASPNLPANPITGKPSRVFCDTARLTWHWKPLCGPDALWFKPRTKRTLFEKLFK